MYVRVREHFHELNQVYVNAGMLLEFVAILCLLNYDKFVIVSSRVFT